MDEQKLKAILSGLADDYNRAVYISILVSAHKLSPQSSQVAWARDYFSKLENKFDLLSLEWATGNRHIVRTLAEDVFKRYTDKGDFVTAGNIASTLKLEERAVAFFKEALQIAQKDGDFPLAISLYKRLGDNEGHREYVQKRIDEKVEKKQWADVAWLYNLLGNREYWAIFVGKAIDEAIAEQRWYSAAGYALELGEAERAMLYFERGGHYIDALQLAGESGDTQKIKFYQEIIKTLQIGVQPPPQGIN
ncbi:hypothetical protein HY501_00660 [Candidatus Woesearchaeota archaeon]|nr:hypothetical protein [Candidatus Woesearchaeota archaeon]